MDIKGAREKAGASMLAALSTMSSLPLGGITRGAMDYSFSPGVKKPSNSKRRMKNLAKKKTARISRRKNRA